MTAVQPDVITARDTGAKFTPHIEGQFAAVCVDTIDLGDRVESFAGKPRKLTPKCALVFLTGEVNPDTGELSDIHAEFTISMNGRAGLRLFLEAWRGKSYTDEQAKDGVSLHKLVGQPALISVEHKISQSDRVYAKIKSIQPLPKAMKAELRADELATKYQRAEFWADRKERYREDAKAFRASNVSNNDDYTDATNDDDRYSTEGDLPF